MTSQTDVVVVGAGFTGLSAATALRERGISTIVLEARDRVGGRVESGTNALGERMDTGGQFLCEDMPTVMALARDRGRTLVESFVRGSSVMQPALGEEETARLYDATFALRERMSAISPEEATDRTVAEWLAAQPEDAEARQAFRSMMEGLWCQALEIVPLGYLADNDRRVTNEAHELQYFPAETMHSLAADLAGDIEGSLRLAVPVKRIVRRDDGLGVETGGERFHARQVIVAVPPVAASRIAFEPALPVPLARALSSWRSGTVIKVLLRYREPFWRDKGLSGTVMWRDVHGLFACDVSRDMDSAALVVFLGGPLALSWRRKSTERMHADLIERLAAAIGPEARETIAFTCRDWCDDRWSGGAYSDIVVDMGADAEARLTAGWPPLHFAASELSPSFPGYIEGALVAGRIAADKVAVMLEGQSFSATSASGS